jgi:hypothetical protein
MDVNVFRHPATAANIAARVVKNAVMSASVDMRSRYAARLQAAIRFGGRPKSETYSARWNSPKSVASPSNFRDSSNIMASRPKEADNSADASGYPSSGAINPNSSGNMISGPNRPPRGRYNGNRPFGQQPRPPQRNQSFDSNGPNIKIRGSAHQIFERYVALAREAVTSGDRVAAENLYQHAEHYFRIANASRDDNQQGTPPRPTTSSDAAISEPEAGSSETDQDRSQTGWGGDRPGFI